LVYLDIKIRNGEKMANDLEGKTIVVTGANSGIGKAVAVQLAARGARVVMACRSAERGRIALEEVKRASGNDRLELMLVDMSSQKSIRQFAESFKKDHPRLDVLIHNAANFDKTLAKPLLTEDGIETIFATNHLGPFLLTGLLLDRLKQSAPSRVITVSSKSLIVFPRLGIEFDNLNGERHFSVTHAYVHSKQAQVMFTYALAEKLKGTGVSVNCVRVTSVAVPDERLAHLPLWMRKVYDVKRKLSITPDRQAQTYVFLAADPAGQEISGGYWDENNLQVRSNDASYDRELQEKLWLASERLTGIRY
jgi:NAD(P)-dependent dehydrogenase (short-subunit alcohol dehydrogenase family)